MTVLQFSLTEAIHRRIALALAKDASVPAMSMLSHLNLTLTGSGANYNMENKHNAVSGSAISQEFNRNMSQAYATLIRYASCTSSQFFTGGEPAAANMSISRLAAHIVNRRSLLNVAISEYNQEIVTELNPAALDPEAKGPERKSSTKNSLSTENLYSSTAQLAAEWVSIFTKCCEDLASNKISDTSFVSLRTVWDAVGFGIKWDDSFGDIFTPIALSAQQGRNSMDALPDNGSTEYFKQMTMLMQRVGSLNSSIDVSLNGSWGKVSFANQSAPGSKVELILRSLWKLAILTDVDCYDRVLAACNAVSATQTLENPVKGALVTMQRATIVSALQMFFHLQSFVALIQLCFSSFNVDELKKFVFSSNATILDSIEFDDVYSKIMALPVAKSSCDILSNFPKPGAVVVPTGTEALVFDIFGAVDDTVSVSSEENQIVGTECESLAQQLCDNMVNIYRIARSLIKSNQLLEVYDQGASYAASGSITYDVISRDGTNFPVSQYFYGSVVDTTAPQTSLEQADLSFEIAVPVNIQNSMTYVAMSHTSKADAGMAAQLLPYALSTFHPSDTTDEDVTALNALIAQDKASISSLWRFRIPFKTVARRTSSSHNRVFIPNREFVSYGNPAHVPFPLLQSSACPINVYDEEGGLIPTDQVTTQVTIERPAAYDSPLIAERENFRHTFSAVKRAAFTAAQTAVRRTNLPRWLGVDASSASKRMGAHPYLARLVDRTGAKDASGSPLLHSLSLVTHPWLPFMSSNFFVHTRSVFGEAWIVIPNSPGLAKPTAIPGADKIGNASESLSLSYMRGWVFRPFCVKTSGLTLTLKEMPLVGWDKNKCTDLAPAISDTDSVSLLDVIGE